MRLGFEKSQTPQARRRNLLRTLPLGTVGPAFYIALAWIYQNNLWGVMHHSWPIALLTFAVGAGTVALPGKFPLLGSLVAILVFAWLSSQTPFSGFALIMFIFAGFFFGICVRSIIYQLRQPKPAAKTSPHR